MMKKNRIFNLKILLVLIGATIFISCSSSPKVEKNLNFTVERYLGKWYEIKRLDHSFERNLKNVTANYTLEKNNEISIINRGIDEKNKERLFEAVAKQTEVPNFFKVHPKNFPIVSAQYNVAWISDDYNYAIVTSSSYEYLWFLSRERTIPLNIYNSMLEKAKKLGFKVENLIDGQ